MTSAIRIFARAVRKFESRTPLDQADRAALCKLPFDLRHVEANRTLLREGDRPAGATLIVQGLAFRHKVTVEGARQILSVQIPGDFIDLEVILLGIADYNVQALTACEVAIVPREAMLKLIDSHPRVGRAMWIDTLVDASIYREWIVNLGRRDSRSGLCHLLCEFARRLEVAGQSGGDGHDLSMTQEQLADALGITPVHVNRILRELDREGLVVRDHRLLRVPSWEALRKAGGFSDLYLHLDRRAAGPLGPPPARH